ncbi:MAG: glycerophosphodiester phosphodiesterase [Actinobacteria bacterium]|nr:glycerophosphodiester phosphodiesterase [Actinomycetota bacterium]
MILRRGDGGVVRVGHRGAAALAPENSLAAIEAAAAVGVDLVEVDVLRRPDGRLMIAHGPEIPPGAPLLDEALALVARLGLGVQLDVKVPGLAAEVVAAAGEHGLLDRAFVSSYSARVLGEFRAAEPSLPRSFTYPEDRLGLSGRLLLRPGVRAGLVALRLALPARLPAWLRAVDASAATLNWAVASPRAIAACHRLGCAAFVWTVNDAKLVKILLESGADGIITDDPRLFAGTMRP